ncbi:MAG: hypothetical protein ACI8S6_001961 [Myxococcota bacterium]|jgi:hypothetical protein
MGPVDQRALSVTVWIVVLVVASGLVAHHQGLDHLPASSWPTDRFTYDALYPETPDLLLVGSSRLAFGAVPKMLGECASVPTAASLTQNYGSVVSSAILLREAVAAGGTPEVVVFEVSPEVVSASSPYLTDNLRQSATWHDLGPCVAATNSSAMLSACLRPLVAGLDGLGRYLSGRHRADPHSRWMMQHHGGGQYCFDGPTCKQSNAAVVAGLKQQWDRRAEELPELIASYYKDYALGVGLGHRYLEQSIALARQEGFSLLLLNMPVHDSYQDLIPEEAYARYQEYLASLEGGPVTVIDANRPQLRRDKRLFIDPDHLRPAGARKLTRQLCRTLNLSAPRAAPPRR